MRLHATLVRPPVAKSRSRYDRHSPSGLPTGPVSGFDSYSFQGCSYSTCSCLIGGIGFLRSSKKAPDYRFQSTALDSKSRPSSALLHGFYITTRTLSGSPLKQRIALVFGLDGDVRVRRAPAAVDSAWEFKRTTCRSPTGSLTTG
jgi:hypothetical protein